MPAYSLTIPDLEHTGPILDIEVLPSRPVLEMLQEKRGGMEPLVVRAMIDTGASMSVIQAGLLDSFGIFPTNRLHASTPTSSGYPCGVYPLQLLMPGHHERPLSVDVVELPLQGQHVQFLIGRDILQFGVFIYQGHIDSFTLSF
jgi:hypothetical protein